MEADTFNIKGLESMLKALKAKPPVARVGILGSDTNRTNQKGGWSGSTNAEIGACHEFGTSKIPQRSFLRIPISEHLDEELEGHGVFTKDELAEVVRTGDLRAWVKKIAILAEGIVQDAFDTGGFGKWPPWKNAHYMNNSGQLLVDTTQLRNSITSEVK